MKLFRLFFITVFSICSLVSLQSCTEDNEYFTGYQAVVHADPSTVHNGESITLSLENTKSSFIEIDNGAIARDYIKHINFYIDKIWVAQSTLKEGEKEYFTTYQIKDLSIGKHVVTADFVTHHKNQHINATFTPDTLTVVK